MKIIKVIFKIFCILIILTLVITNKLKTQTSTHFIVKTVPQEDTTNEILNTFSTNNAAKSDVHEDLNNEDINLDMFIDEENDLVSDNNSVRMNTELNANNESNNSINFLQIKNPKITGKDALILNSEKNDTNYFYSSLLPKDIIEKNKHDKMVITAHSNKIASDLIGRKINTSVSQKIEGSFRKYKLRHEGINDDLTNFLSFLKEASEKTSLKRSVRQKIINEGFVPVSTKPKED